MQSHLSCVWIYVTPWTVAPSPLCPCDSPGKNSRVGCYTFPQGIFQTQGLNPLSLMAGALEAGSLSLVSPGKSAIIFF